MNNAGVTRDNLIMRMTEEDYDTVLDTNLKGAFHMIRHLSRSFIKQRGGKIINISSGKRRARQCGTGKLFGVEGGADRAYQERSAGSLQAAGSLSMQWRRSFIDTDMTVKI